MQKWHRHSVISIKDNSTEPKAIDGASGIYFRFQQILPIVQHLQVLPDQLNLAEITLIEPAKASFNVSSPPYFLSPEFLGVHASGIPYFPFGIV